MCWGCGSARAVLVVEHDDETEVIGSIWCWLGRRVVHKDCPSKDDPTTLVCRSGECSLFPPDRLA